MDLLKFEGIPIGTNIRAYDFEPCPGREDCYIEGKIIGIDKVSFHGYVVEVTFDSWSPEGGGRERVKVPFETGMDWDGRVITEDELLRIADLDVASKVYP